MPHQMRVMPFQREFIVAPERFLTFFAGRRCGKTDGIKKRIKWRTQKPGFTYMYITPLFAQGLEVYQEIVNDSTYKHQIKRKRERPFPHYTLHNGSRVKFKSFQRANGIRSTGEDEICLDESQDPVVTEYDVQTIVLPMLGDKRGSLVMAGQFRGHDWRYSQYWLRGQREIDGKPNPAYHPKFKSWRIPSSSGYVFQGEEGRAELDLQRSITPRAVWDQEWDCIPTANANAVFLPQQIDAVIGGTQRLSPEPGRRYIAGLDLGRLIDQSAFVVLDIDSGDVVYAEKLPQRMEHAEQARRIGQLARMFNCCVVVDVTGGATGGQATADTWVQYYRQQIPDMREFIWSRSNKEKIIAQLALEIEQRRIRIPAEHIELLKELRAYEYTYERGYYSYSAPKNLHDDYVSSLAMAVWGKKSGWAAPSGSVNMGMRF
jgi:hypothetical protein